VFLRSKGEGVDIDTSVRGTGMVLERLDLVEVRSFTLRETVLAVKLELSGDDRVLAPTVHVEGSLSKDEGTGIRDTRFIHVTTSITSKDIIGIIITRNIRSTRHLEKTRGINKGVSTRGSIRSREGMDSVRESIDGIGIVERLGTKGLVEKTVSIEG